MQAQFNEALIVMFAGYHPDHYWQDAADRYMPRGTQASSPSSSPSEKKTDGFNGMATIFETKDDSSASRDAPKDGSHLEEQIQVLMSQLEKQSRQLERQSEELGQLKSLVQIDVEGARESTAVAAVEEGQAGEAAN